MPAQLFMMYRENSSVSSAVVSRDSKKSGALRGDVS